MPEILKRDIGLLSRVLRAFMRRKATATHLSATDWGEVPLEVRERSFWSAKLAHAEHVSELKQAILESMAGSRKRITDLRRNADPRSTQTLLWTRDQIISEMRKAAIERGIMPTGLREIESQASPARIRLIFDMATGQTYGRARYEAGNDPAVLSAFPAQRLVRMGPRRVPRDWETRWMEAGEAVGWEGALQHKAIALKTSPIWEQLSAFGLPYPPFDYNSGMGVIAVSRAEAEKLGLIEPEETPTPRGTPHEYRGSVKSMRPDVREWLLCEMRDRLGDGVSIEGGELIYRRP